MSKTENGTIPLEGSRLCHMIKRSDFDGYGFNLHSEKGKPGQFIGKVDEKSPAEDAGLHQGDRIIEVNGVNIGNETHKQVVQRIKAILNEVKLLVIDPEIEKNQKQQQQQQQQQNIIPNKIIDELSTSTTSTATLQSIITKNEPDINKINDSPKKMKSFDKQENNSPILLSNNNSIESSPSSINKNNLNNNIGNNNSNINNNNNTNKNNNNNNNANIIQNDTNGHLAIANRTENRNINLLNDTIKTVENDEKINDNNFKKNSLQLNQQNGNTNDGNIKKSTGLNLTMTAAEMRAKLQAKKKYDPKNDSVDLRKKFEIVQKL